MSEANPPPKPASGGPGDPQMDDILASIRRILNEDEAAGAAPGMPPPPAFAAAEPGAEPEPLELTEAMLVQPPQVAAASPPVAPPAVEPPPAPALPAPPPAMASDMLVAPAVAAATTAAMGQLLRTVAQERAALVSRGGPSIEDVVREEIRPILKEWLDRHLPPLVERLVRVEIERVVGRTLP